MTAREKELTELADLRRVLLGASRLKVEYLEERIRTLQRLLSDYVGPSTEPIDYDEDQPENTSWETL